METVEQINAGISGGQWFLIALAALVVIAIVIKLISVLVRTFSKQEVQTEIPEEKAAPAQMQVDAAPQPPAAIPPAERQKLLAVISAAIAEDMGVEISSLRIHSLRPLGAPAVFSRDRQQITAAISAAIAEDMGTDISCLRIHGIRPISARAATGGTANQGLLAAIAATLAEDMGTDVSHLRIHAVRRV